MVLSSGMCAANAVTKPASPIGAFQRTSIRRVWRKEEWWFDLSDVIVVLTNSRSTATHQKDAQP
jgi:hypothetical protein